MKFVSECGICVLRPVLVLFLVCIGVYISMNFHFVGDYEVPEELHEAILSHFRPLDGLRPPNIDLNAWNKLLNHYMERWTSLASTRFRSSELREQIVRMRELLGVNLLNQPYQLPFRLQLLRDKRVPFLDASSRTTASSVLASLEEHSHEKELIFPPSLSHGRLGPVQMVAGLGVDGLEWGLNALRILNNWLASNPGHSDTLSCAVHTCIMCTPYIHFVSEWDDADEHGLKGPLKANGLMVSQ